LKVHLNNFKKVKEIFKNMNGYDDNSIEISDIDENCNIDIDN
jgi:hypothetical protein